MWYRLGDTLICLTIPSYKWGPKNRLREPFLSAGWLEIAFMNLGLLNWCLSNTTVTVKHTKMTWISKSHETRGTVYPKKYAHGFCFAVLCCGYTLTDFPISIRLTSLALWQSNDCPNASKATLMNMDKYFMWIHYERLHNHNKAKHNKTVCIFLGIYCRPLLPNWQALIKTKDYHVLKY